MLETCCAAHACRPGQDREGLLLPAGASLEDLLRLGEEVLPQPPGGCAEAAADDSDAPLDERSVLGLAKYLLSKASA